jgi:integrase
LEIDEALSLIDAAGTLDRRRTSPTEELRSVIVRLRDEDRLPWKRISERVERNETTCICHYQRQPKLAIPVRRTIIATLALAGLRIGELCALNCAHIDLAHQIIRVLDAET